MIQMRDITLNQTGTAGYTKAQAAAFALRSKGYRADENCQPSPAGLSFDRIYLFTDAPKPVVRKALRAENASIAGEDK
jgi:hypothetical protein